jgi:Zinc finger, C3HC4 type (RING finger)
MNAQAFCYCDLPAACLKSHTARNPNRMFYSCANKYVAGVNHCDYFCWVDSFLSSYWRPTLPIPPRPQQKHLETLPAHVASVFWENSQHKTCPVCLGDTQDGGYLVTHCGHIYCTECLEVVREKFGACSVCRQK